jgi:single-strand DNA-binding protein
MNKVTLIGRLGKDPETRQIPTGSVTSVSLATSEKYTDKQGQKVEKTEWHNLVFWGKLAEIAGQYLHKGDLIAVEGSIETVSWEKDGQKLYKTQIKVTNMEMLQGKRENEPINGSQSAQVDHPRQSASFTNEIPF